MTDRTDESQGSTMTNSDSVSSTSRRQLLQVGGLGALGAAFLAACGSDSYETRPGVAGAGAPATSTPPTVPPAAPNSAQREAEQNILHTLTSVEALLGETYQAHSSSLTDPELRAACERFATDHEEAAQTIASHTESGEADPPNEDLRTRMVAPVERRLEPLLEAGTETAQVTANTTVLDLFRKLETSLAATYVASMGTLTTAESRGELGAFGAAAARRAAVMTDDPTSTAPTTALFPVTDLIPGSSFMGAATEEPAEGEGAEGEEAEG